jgi:hypothetical protein
MLAEDNQFIAKGDLISDYIKILDNFGKDESMIYFFAQQGHKLEKQNNRATGPHTIKTTELSFFTPIEQKWDMGAICSRGLYDGIKQMRQARGISEEESWDILHGLIVQNTLLFTLSDFRRIYPAIPCGLWMHNDHRDDAITKITKKTADNPDYILYNMVGKSQLFDLLENKTCKIPFSTENFLIES